MDLLFMLTFKKDTFLCLTKKSCCLLTITILLGLQWSYLQCKWLWFGLSHRNPRLYEKQTCWEKPIQTVSLWFQETTALHVYCFHPLESSSPHLSEKKRCFYHTCVCILFGFQWAQWVLSQQFKQTGLTIVQDWLESETAALKVKGEFVSMHLAGTDDHLVVSELYFPLIMDFK